MTVIYKVVVPGTAVNDTLGYVHDGLCSEVVMDDCRTDDIDASRVRVDADLRAVNGPVVCLGCGDDIRDLPPLTRWKN
jgi:hypothetical protein